MNAVYALRVVRERNALRQPNDLQSHSVLFDLEYKRRRLLGTAFDVVDLVTDDDGNPDLPSIITAANWFTDRTLTALNRPCGGANRKSRPRAAPAHSHPTTRRKLAVPSQNLRWAAASFFRVNVLRIGHWERPRQIHRPVWRGMAEPPRVGIGRQAGGAKLRQQYSMQRVPALPAVCGFRRRCAPLCAADKNQVSIA